MPWGLWLALAAVTLDVVLRGAVVRWVWRELVLALTRLDLACAWMVRACVRPRYVLRGRCQKRGLCCRNIVADPPRLMKARPRLMALYAGYHRVMHNFQVVATTASGGLVFSCGHLKSDGRCGIYRHRPRLCRAYPVLPFFGPPRLLPGCGFQVAHRAVAAMRRRASLPIVNPQPTVHHPTPPGRRDGARHEEVADFHLVDGPPGPC